jgi:hypothetical protein
MRRPRVTIAALMLAVAAIAGSLASYQAGRRAGPPPTSPVVYTTRRGTHYHAAGCRFAAGPPVPLDAVDRRLRPCAYCRPPALPAR